MIKADMRTLILAILISLVAAGEAAAMEALWGRVVSIDRQARLMVVHARPMAPGPAKNTVDTGVPPGKELTVKFPTAELPPCVAAGTVVRLWGGYSQKDSGVFNARFIRGAGRRSWGYDPTGVRQRLGMHGGHGRHGKGPPAGWKNGGHSCARTKAP